MLSRSNIADVKPTRIRSGLVRCSKVTSGKRRDSKLKRIITASRIGAKTVSSSRRAVNSIAVVVVFVADIDHSGKVCTLDLESASEYSTLFVVGQLKRGSRWWEASFGRGRAPLGRAMRGALSLRFLSGGIQEERAPCSFVEIKLALNRRPRNC
jgi:hypothetical protein